SVGEVVHAIDQAVERRAVPERRDGPRKPLGVTDAHDARLAPRCVRGVSRVRHLKTAMPRTDPCPNLTGVTPPRAASITIAALCVGALVQYLFIRQVLGVNVPLTVVVLLTIAFALRPRGATLDARDAWLPLGAIPFGALCAIRTDAPLVAVDLVG